MSKKLSKLIFQQFEFHYVCDSTAGKEICARFVIAISIVRIVQVTRLFQSLLSKSEIALLQNNSGYPPLFWDFDTIYILFVC